MMENVDTNIFAWIGQLEPLEMYDNADLLPFDQGGTSFILAQGLDKILKIQPITSSAIMENSKLECLIHKTLCDALPSVNIRGLFGIPEFYSSGLQATLAPEIVASLNLNLKSRSKKFTANYPCTVTQMERIDGDNMKEFLLNSGKIKSPFVLEISQENIKNVFLQLAVILDHLDRKCGFRHNDIKLQNIILCKNTSCDIPIRYSPGGNLNWEFCVGEYSVFLVDFGCSLIDGGLMSGSGEMPCFTTPYLPISKLVTLEPGKKFYRDTFDADSWCYGLCLYFSVYSGWTNTFGMINPEWLPNQIPFASSEHAGTSILSLFWTIDKSQRHNQFHSTKDQLFALLHQSMTTKQKLFQGYYQQLLFLVLGVYLLCKLVLDIPVLDWCDGGLYGNSLRYLEDNPEVLENFETISLPQGKVRFFSQLIKTRVSNKLGTLGISLLQLCLSEPGNFRRILEHEFFENFVEPTQTEKLLDTQETRIHNSRFVTLK